MAAAWRPRVQLLLHLAPPPYAQEGNALLRQLQQQVVHSTAQTQSGSKVPAMSRLVISSQVSLWQRRLMEVLLEDQHL